MSKRTGKNEQLRDLTDWQQKQYTPWQYFSEGKLLPYIDTKRNPKRVAILWFMQASISIFLGIVTFIGYNTSTTQVDQEDIKYVFKLRSESWVFVLMFGFVMLFSLFFGFIYWKKYKDFRKEKNFWHEKHRINKKKKR